MCVALAIAGGAIVGGLISASGAESAASTQAGAAENAQAISQNEFNTITQQEKPYMGAGYGSLAAVTQGLGVGPNTPSLQAPGVGYGSLTTPFTTANWQQLSPAYNFQLQQGQQNVLNANSAGAGSMSGSALKDLTNYNQSLAGTSFNNAFNMYQTQQGNIFSRLSGIAQLGQTAAANTGQQGTALAGQAAQSATNIGTALGAGTVGAANAVSGGLTSALPWLAYGGGGGSPAFTPNYYGDSSTAGWGTSASPVDTSMPPI